MSGSTTNNMRIGRRSMLEGAGLAALSLGDLLTGVRRLQAADRDIDSKELPLNASREQKPLKPLVPWMYMIYPLEQWLDDYRRTFDAWAEGGVRGLVIGPLVFFKEVPRFDFTYARPGFQFPTFQPEPAIYRKH